MTEFESKLPTEIDWTYWCSIPAWTIKEAVCLLLMIEPDRYIDDIGIRETNEFKRLYRFLRRAKQLDEINPLTPPAEIVNWAISRNIPVPKELQLLSKEVSFDEYKVKYLTLKKKFVNVKKKLKRVESKLSSIDSETSKRKSGIYRLIYAMARAKYDFGKSKGNPAKSIEADILFNGMQSPKEETIRNILNDAQDYINEYGKD